ncbi:uncharacterized protein LOC142765912 [Rhipicephalus microplus]|uniref:uncharacterized protein LOC142765912 n=1 Tax=Rhipicephalus microplus TaxID=6941 RepID=UPI003F6AF85C
MGLMARFNLCQSVLVRAPHLMEKLRAGNTNVLRASIRCQGASRPGTPAPTGVSAAASGPPRSRPPVVHQGITTLGYCPSYFNCERSLARHTVARHAQEESTPYIPLRTPRQPTATPSSSSGTETTPPPGPAPSGTFCRAAPEPHTRATVPRSRRRRGGQSSTSRPSSSTGSASSSTATGSLSASSSEASIKPGHSSATSSSGSSTPRQSPSVPGTPPSVPPDPGPPSTTGEVSSTPGSSSRRHTGPGSTSSASRASSRMSTELADVPGTDDYDDASANEPVDEQSVPAVGTVVDHRPLSTNSRSSSSPSLSERLEDTGADDADDGAHDTPAEAPTMEMPPDRTMLLAE